MKLQHIHPFFCPLLLCTFKGPHAQIHSLILLLHTTHCWCDLLLTKVLKTNLAYYTQKNNLACR